MKSSEADVLIVSVRHVPFRDADELLSKWNPKLQGYVFHIFSENLYVQDYLQRKYLEEEKQEDAGILPAGPGSGRTKRNTKSL